VEVLLEIGVDLSRHRAIRLTKELVDLSDVIVAMTGEHKEAVLAFNPCYASRVLILGELDPERISPDIFDPIGGDRGVYTKSRAEISALIDRLMEYLIEKFKLKG
jgi:protein-tyrosine phosphatase